MKLHSGKCMERETSLHNTKHGLKINRLGSWEWSFFVVAGSDRKHPER